MKPQSCMKCGKALAAPGTPARRHPHARGVLCGPCLAACRGSLLYSVPGDALEKFVRSCSAAGRDAWLDSLSPYDQDAAHDFMKRRGIPT